ARGQSQPHHDNLHSLVTALPQYRYELLYLIRREYPGFTTKPAIVPPEMLAEIPAEFYAQIMGVYSTCPAFLRSSAIRTLIIEQILAHLDPQRQGLSVIVVRYVPPRHKGEKVKSLYLVDGKGTPPWPGELALWPVFFGAESQIGKAIASGHHITVNTSETRTQLFAQHQTPLEKSTVAYPLLQSDRCPGCLGIGSTESSFFSRERLDILQAYAYLMVLAFEPEEFYDLHEIDLGIMPPAIMQEKHASRYKQLVEQCINEIPPTLRPDRRRQAEIIVLQDLQDELLQLAFSSREHTNLDR
ncbi:MAG: GAF domain-containing protein, partial [Ktedonobacteraceae bacterium]|nr:GAF domain-containing protein [Ktedonobacteraceae bacterium]